VTAADIPAPAADGVIDLLGLLAYGSLTAFFRMSEDAALAESIDDQAALAGLAVAEFGHFQLARARIERSAADPAMAMQPFMAAVDAFHARTEPADWLEGLVKAYVGAGVAADFYGEVAGRLALWARRLVGEALGQAQRVAAERAPLARLLTGGSASLGDIGRMFAALTDAHTRRMAALGLEP